MSASINEHSYHHISVRGTAIMQRASADLNLDVPSAVYCNVHHDSNDHLRHTRVHHNNNNDHSHSAW